MKKNLFLTFCFSFIPGAGQMYQQYMKRGLSIMILFACSIGILSLTSLPIFAIPIPIICVFSFFDTYNIRNKICETKNENLPDDFIWNSEAFKSLGIKFNTKNNVIAVIFILVGAYVLFNNVFLSLANRYDIEILSVSIKTVLNYLPSIIIAILSIFVGIKFIGKNK